MSSEEAGPPKKKHRRSRGGCMQCKAQKKKCTEELPSCARCASYDTPIECIYPAPRRAATSASNGSAPQPSLQRPVPIPPPFQSTAQAPGSLAEPQPFDAEPPPWGAPSSEMHASTSHEIELMDAISAFSPSLFVGHWEANNSNEAAPGAAAPPSFPALPLLSVLPDATPASLLAYFASTFARTIVAEYDDDNIYTRDIVPLLSRGLPSAEGGGDVSGPMSALLHASYSMSCTHSFNLGRQSVSLGTLVDEEGQLEKLQQLAKSHATSALTMLRTSKAAEGDAEPVLELELRGAAVMMLVLQAMSLGDSKLIPSLLVAAEKGLLQLHELSPSPMSASMLMLHSVYTLADRVARQQPCAELCWAASHSNKDANGPSSSSPAEKILGASAEVFELWREVHNLTLRLGSSFDDEQAVWERIGIQQELDGLEEQLGARARWAERWQGRPERVKAGNECWRAALRVMVLRKGFAMHTEERRVQSEVKRLVKALETIPLGSEVGLSWPLVLVGSEALGADRNSILNFSKRCQWRGSSASRQVEVALMAAWNGGVCWQTSFRESGCPLVL